MPVSHGLLDPSTSSSTTTAASSIPPTSDSLSPNIPPIPPTSLSGDHTHFNDTQNHPPASSSSPTSNHHPSVSNQTQETSDMIAVQHSPSLPERGSYFDHDDEDDTIHPTTASRLSQLVNPLNPFRLFSSAEPPMTQSDSPHQSTQDLSASHPPQVIDGQFPSQSSFTFPQVSPPTSPLQAASSHRSRPSLEGVFDPTPRTTREIKNLPSNASSKNSATTSRKRLSTNTSSSNSSRPSSKRPLPHGENPLIFGPVAPRRISKSVPLHPGPSIDTALASATIRGPSLSITSPTPQPSPSRPRSTPGLSTGATIPPSSEPDGRSSSLRKPGTGNSPPKTVTYDDQVRLSGSGRSKGKRKSEELDTSTSSPPCDEEGRIAERDRSRRGSEHPSNASSTTASTPAPPSAYASAARRNSKRIKLTPATPEGTTTPPSPSTARDPSLRPSRPSSKASQRPRSIFGASQGSLPLSAIISPRPPSVIQSDYYGRGNEGLFMRDPRHEWGNWNVSWNPRTSGHNNISPPRSAFLFYLGFLMPLLWLIGALMRNTSGLSSDIEEGTSAEKQAQTKKWDQQAWETSQWRRKVYKTWRDRNRFMALLSLITYLPIVVCLAVFVPR